jgi:hypothetical protein
LHKRLRRPPPLSRCRFSLAQWARRRFILRHPPSAKVPSEMRQFITWFNLTVPGGVEPRPALTRAGGGDPAVDKVSLRPLIAAQSVQVYLIDLDSRTGGQASECGGDSRAWVPVKRPPRPDRSRQVLLWLEKGDAQLSRNIRWRRKCCPLEIQ